MSHDLIRHCVECGTAFVWTTSEQIARNIAPECCPMCLRLAPQDGRQRGLIKWFSRAKGYGFVAPVTGTEVFLHKSGLAAGQVLPRAGQLVEYRLGHGARGAQAEDVVILEAIEMPQ